MASAHEGTATTHRTTFSRTTSVQRAISAEPATIWSLLTTAAAYPQWNSTVLSLDGAIRQGGRIRLVSALAPERPFTLRIKQCEPPARLVWGDAMGTRTFSLSPAGPGTTLFRMTERIGGPLFPLFAGKIPDFDDSFTRFAADLKTAAEAS
ncbi:SRPBCC domain-containing protein [Arthrobacter mangrovi]|nr:SRPBCC domain-containing protein [Arthrobacter mangrovi]